MVVRGQDVDRTSARSIRVIGPVTKLSNGVKGLYLHVLATRLVIASTGAMLTVGHEAPFRISTLACRIECCIRFAKDAVVAYRSWPRCALTVQSQFALEISF
jgi:hypothetical protein